MAMIPIHTGCLVLDVAMPGLSGLDLQEALCSKAIELPIIFLTARGDIPMSVQAMKRGAVDFLQKPANDEELLEAIRTGIDRDVANRQVRADRLGIRAETGHVDSAREGSPPLYHFREAK